MFPMTPDTYTLHVVVALALSIRARDETSSSASSSSLSRPLRRAWLRRSTSDDQPANTPPNTFWAEALRHLRRHANRSPPTSWAEVLIDLLWNFGAGLLGVAFLGELLQLRHGRAGSTGYGGFPSGWMGQRTCARR